MLLLKLGLVFSTLIALYGEWYETHPSLPFVAACFGFVCFVVLALAFTDDCTKDYKPPKTDDGPP